MSEAGSAATWAMQVWLLTARLGVETLKNPVLLLNLVLAVFFLLVYDGSLGGTDLLVELAHGNYYDFILPAAVLAASVAGGAAGLMLVSDMTSRYLYRQLTMPIRRSALVSAALLVAALQVMLQAAAVIGVGLLLGADPEAGLGGIAVVLCLALAWGLGFAGYSVIVGAVSRDVQLTSAANLIFIPLIFMSPLLVPFEYLKPWVQDLSGLNPASYVMEGMRSLTVFGWRSEPLLKAFAACASFALITVMGAVVVVRRLTVTK